MDLRISVVFLEDTAFMYNIHGGVIEVGVNIYKDFCSFFKRE